MRPRGAPVLSEEVSCFVGRFPKQTFSPESAVCKSACCLSFDYRVLI